MIKITFAFPLESEGNWAPFGSLTFSTGESAGETDVGSERTEAETFTYAY